jgi:hypothetical protein
MEALKIVQGGWSGSRSRAPTRKFNGPVQAPVPPKKRNSYLPLVCKLHKFLVPLVLPPSEPTNNIDHNLSK